MASRFDTRPAQTKDSDELIALIAATPQTGAITINFERKPDFFMATNIVTQTPDVWVAIERESERVAAIFSIGHRDVYVNGSRQKVRYGNDLRIHPDFKSGRTLFNLLKCYRQAMGKDWMQTVILSDNNASLNSIGSGRSITPTYYDFGEMTTHMLYLTRPRVIRQGLTRPRLALPSLTQQSKFNIRKADHNDIELMQEFFEQQAKTKQFYPHYDFIKLLNGDEYYRGLVISNYYLMFEGNRLVAMAGIWDQSSFKQTRFVAYSKLMAVGRLLNNVYSTLFGGMMLPKAGDKLSYVSLHSLLVINDDEKLFSRLLAHIYNDCLAQNYQALVCGLPSVDSRQRILEQYRSKVLYSKHFIASYHDDPRGNFDNTYPLYLEPARL
ncbi:hypothetical protein FR932_08920 [Moritella marina ATCC 15381]|uniref:N-acetyltransferase domain-containing protein n=1 Tax=Moritella marina ATCC 15381 TaxID=1202962 RepID=A0A5J6WIW1_MORMI|nr:hypothetical protein [Moritella marina]QFI37963.1 hypothetical protein FR932_08920 [Moritella marina ATCC 15381]